MRLTNSKVCVYGGIACRASQVLVLPVGDVLVCSGIAVLFGKAKVNDVHQVTLLAKPHKEVVRLDVSMDEILRVDVLDATDLMKIQKTNRCCQVVHPEKGGTLGHITFHVRFLARTFLVLF